jgi:predicted transcriptional regulator
MIKNENYYVVSGWMLNELKLKGNDLIVYALIYSFSQDGETEFKGSITYITEFTGAGRKTVNRSITHLISLGLVEKNEQNSITGKTNSYRAIPFSEIDFRKVGQNDLRGASKSPTPYDNMTYGVRQNDLRGASKRPTINISNNISNNNINNYKDKVSKKVSNSKQKIESYDEIFDAFETSPAVKRTLIEFIKHSQLNGVQIINSRLEHILFTLDLTFRTDDDAKVKYINAAIRKGLLKLPCEE